MLAVGDISKLEARLQAMAFSLKLETAAAEARAKIDAITAAVTAIKTSSGLLRLLEHVMAIGNFLNGEHAWWRGQAT